MTDGNFLWLLAKAKQIKMNTLIWSAMMSSQDFMQIIRFAFSKKQLKKVWCLPLLLNVLQAPETPKTNFLPQRSVETSLGTDFPELNLNPSPSSENSLIVIVNKTPE